MVLHPAVTVLREAADTVPGEVTAHREVDMGLEEASAEVLHLLAGTAGDVAGMVLLEWDLDLVDRLRQDMELILTTALRVEWHLSTGNDHRPCKISSWLEALHPAMTLLLARPLRWTNEQEAHQAPYRNRLHLTV